MKADDLMQELWLGLRDDCSSLSLHHARGAILMAESSGLFDREKTELWRRRIDTCPGHDGEGGRSWCAYCGDMPRSSEAAP